MCNQQKERKQVNCLIKAEQYDPKEIFTHYSAQTNLEYGPRELLTKTNNVYKTIKKN